MRRRFLRLATLPLLILALAQFADAILIHGKAAVAPLLLEHAWQRSLEQQQAVRPWPWADTAPVARLRIPRLGLRRIVLEGDSGEALAFGPGLSAQAARPGQPGLAMISAHRDTHFRFLRRLQPGDQLQLDYGARRFNYRVRGYRIANARDGRLPGPLPSRGLLLVTCYPFDAIRPGGSLRYVVIADQLPAAPSVAGPGAAAVPSNPLVPRPDRGIVSL